MSSLLSTDNRIVLYLYTSHRGIQISVTFFFPDRRPLTHAFSRNQRGGIPGMLSLSHMPYDIKAFQGSAFRAFVWKMRYFLLLKAMFPVNISASVRLSCARQRLNSARMMLSTACLPYSSKRAYFRAYSVRSCSTVHLSSCS